MNGSWKEILGVFALPAFWLGSIEVRLRNKVGRDEFNLVVDQGKRIESHVWDIMKAQNITPSIEPPEEIKNNSNRKEA